jgi:hypothetical protein
MSTINRPFGKDKTLTTPSLPTGIKTTRLVTVELTAVMVESAILTYLKDLAAAGVIPDPSIAKSTRLDFVRNHHDILGGVKVIYTLPDEA